MTAEAWNDDALMDAVADSVLNDSDEDIFADERLAVRLAADAIAAQTNRERADTEQAADAFVYRFRMERAVQRFIRAMPRRAVRETFPPIYGVAADVMPFAAGSRHAIMVEPRVAAGAGTDLWDAPVESWLELPRDVPAGDYVAFPVIGDSMSPAVESGDIVLVRLGRDVVIGDVVVARADDGYVVKYVTDVRDAVIELGSFNPDHRPLSIERDPRRIVGKVLARFHR